MNEDLNVLEIAVTDTAIIMDTELDPEVITVPEDLDVVIGIPEPNLLLVEVLERGRDGDLGPQGPTGPAGPQGPPGSVEDVILDGGNF
jgi:hypothetical protein